MTRTLLRGAILSILGAIIGYAIGVAMGYADNYIGRPRQCGDDDLALSPLVQSVYEAALAGNGDTVTVPLSDGRVAVFSGKLVIPASATPNGREGDAGREL